MASRFTFNLVPSQSECDERLTYPLSRMDTHPPSDRDHGRTVRRVTVIGGGVVGLAVAYELVTRGITVRLLDRDRIGRGTSWAAAGILPPAALASATDPLDRLRGLSQQRLQQLAVELREQTGIDPGLRACGGWYLADSAGERAAMIGMQGYWQSLGIECQPLVADELAAREPALAPWVRATDQAAVWWVPEEWQIRPPRLLAALAAACRQRGVLLQEQATVRDLRPGPDIIETVVGEQTYPADAVVICGGAWSGLIADRWGLQRSLVPIRGQMVLFKLDQPPLRSIVNLGHRYILCREDGHVLVGSCEEEVGFEFGNTAIALQELRAFAFRLMPQLRQATELDAWSGLRPMTYEGLPMIGALPGNPRVLMAAGHYRSGIQLAAGTAVCIAALLSGVTPPVGLDHFHIAGQAGVDCRFAERPSPPSSNTGQVSSSIHECIR